MGHSALESVARPDAAQDAYGLADKWAGGSRETQNSLKSRKPFWCMSLQKFKGSSWKFKGQLINFLFESCMCIRLHLCSLFGQASAVRHIVIKRSWGSSCPTGI